MLLSSVLLLLGSASDASAQQPPTQIELVSVEHQPSGRVIAAVRSQPPGALDPAQLVATVDGVSRPATTKAIERTDARAIVVVVDTSGSMNGEAIAAARKAVSDLIALLPATDQVALVAFSDAPRTVVPFTTDRDALLRASGSLVAGGNTALYDAVAVASDMLAASPERERRLVLLSDGVDSGGASQRDRATSIESAHKSGAAVFAFGLGEADRDYLTALAAETSGTAQFIADQGALARVFGDLGSKLSATHEVEITLPVLALGDHSVSLAGTAAGQRFTVTRDFTTTNAGLLKPHLIAERTTPEQIVIGFADAVGLDAVALRAEADGRALTVVRAAQRIIVDSWAFPPSTQTVRIFASLGGLPVGEAALAVEIPALPPQIDVHATSRDGDYLVQWRVQPPSSTDGWTVRATADGREIGRWDAPHPEFHMVVPTQESRIDVALLRPDGTQAAQHQFVVSTSRNTHPLIVPALALLAAGMVGIAMKRRQRTRRPPALAGMHPYRLSPSPNDGSSATASRRGVVIVEGADSDVRYDIGPRPISIGRSKDCDIVIEDEAVRPLHARLSMWRDGSLAVHAVREKAVARPPDGVPDQWLILRAGEQVSIGSSVIRFVTTATTGEESR